MPPPAAESSGSPRSGHYPALDGLRGWAIGIVLLHHGLYYLAGSSPAVTVVRALARTGWVGVELFFVLSGFLITRLLIESRGTPGALRRFYVRRALRILPPYYALLLALLASLPFLSGETAADFRALLRATGWLWTHAFNLYLAHDWVVAGGRHLVRLEPIYHLWSLAVEEQFYVVWPIVVLLVRPARLSRACALALVASVLLRALLAARGVEPNALYVFTPTHLDGFAVGAWLAAAERDPVLWAALERRTAWLSAAPLPRLVSTACVVPLLVFACEGRWAEGARFTLLALAFGAWLVACLHASPSSPLGALTQARWMRALGRYSYTLYLVHKPLLVALGGAATGATTPIVACGGMLVGSGAIAWLSWRVLEQPLLRLKDRIAPPTFVPIAIFPPDPLAGSPPPPLLVVRT